MTAFDEIIREYTDIHDTDTRRYILGLDEAGQNMALNSITNKLYDKIVAKADQIDFGTIPKSKGDITKIEGYDNLIECIELIRGLAKGYNQSLEPIDTVSTAINNVRNRERAFSKAFAIKRDMPVLIYNTIVTSIVASVSFLIDTCIEFIKDPKNETIEMAISKVSYKKTMNNVLFRNLSKFNAACACGDMDNCLSLILQGKPLTEGFVKDTVKSISGHAVGAAAIFIGIIKNIIPLLQEFVSSLFSLKMKVSDFFADQADLIEMNRNNMLISNSDLTEDQKKKVYEKQGKIADRFRKISNAFEVKMGKANKDAADDSKELQMQLNANDFESDSLF